MTFSSSNVSGKGKRKLRKGFTTGASAAAGAKAAAEALFKGTSGPRGRPFKVSLTLPTGARLAIAVKSLKVTGRRAEAVVVKDAGDDPDVTNGAEIVTAVELRGFNKKRTRIRIEGGEGVGVVTRPGLKVAPGHPAINPVPMAMIKQAVMEAARKWRVIPSVTVTVKVPRGRELARRTMNLRLGIVGGISILGTTGIVEPMSLSAYKDSIVCGIDVAKASGISEIVLTTGRSSEKAVAGEKKLPPPAFVLTGDHMGFALGYAGTRSGFKRVTVAGQFGKFTKLACGHSNTHCSRSSVELGFLADLAKGLGVNPQVQKRILHANTAREVFFILEEEGVAEFFKKLCTMVRENARRLAGGSIDIECMLVGYNNDIVCSC